MSDQSTNTTALIVALIALLVASAQLLQAIFGTANGYRRCQRSVMGDWANMTHLRWRWSLFGFETMYTTPDFVLDDAYRLLPSDLGNYNKTFILVDPRKYSPRSLHLRSVDFSRDLYGLLNTLRVGKGLTSFMMRLRPRYLLASKGNFNQSSDLVRWLKLLSALGWTANDNSMQARFAVKLIEHCYDFMPPDVVRPLARTEVATLVIMGHRLGMRWYNLDPAKDEMSAEGTYHLFRSSSIRGLGMVVTYTYKGIMPSHLDESQIASLLSRKSAEHDIEIRSHLKCIPSIPADMMACGIIPVNQNVGNALRQYWQIPRLKLADKLIDRYDMSTLSLEQTLEHFNIKSDAQDIILRAAKDYGSRFVLRLTVNTSGRCPLNDLICLLSKFMPLKGSDLVDFIHPLRHPLLHSPFKFWEGRSVLFRRLSLYVQQEDSDNPLLRYSIDKLKHLENMHGDDFYGRHMKASISAPFEGPDHICKGFPIPAVNHDRVIMLNLLRDLVMSVDQYFRALRPSDDSEMTPCLFQCHLVGSHLSMAAFAAKQNIDKTEDQCPTNNFYSDQRGRHISWPWVAVAHAYVDRLDDVVEHMRSSGWQVDSKKIKEAWWMLVFRGIVWSMAAPLSFDPSIPLVPSNIYEDRTRVYLT